MIIIIIISDCGVMDYKFVMTCCDKFASREKIEKNWIFFFCFLILSTKLFWHHLSMMYMFYVYVFNMMYMFVNCICTRYTKACIHQGLNLSRHETH
jgi:hypothetical protein